MEDNKQQLTSAEEYQERIDREMTLAGYCNKIKKAFDEDIAENCEDGERAIWELVQNACDLSTEARIKIELFTDSLVFTHHGRPFDYKSFYSLVKQDSSKDQDQPDAEPVGRYGTGFMTTHTFNKVVEIRGPFAVMETKDSISGYVQVERFILDRSKVDTSDGPQIMGEQLDEVKRFCKKDKTDQILDDATSFRYVLSEEQVAKVSGQLRRVSRLMPFVLAINSRMREFEIADHYSNKHFLMKNNNAEEPLEPGWHEASAVIELHDLATAKTPSPLVVKSLKSDKGDVVIIPPFPEFCGKTEEIPSLFLWFPLIGTETFGVNFIFHSKRFYPVEKRNNIMIPGKTEPSRIHGNENLEVLKEMSSALFSHYSAPSHSKELKREFCEVSFPVRDDEAKGFFDELQDIWSKQIPTWNIIPIGDVFYRMDNPEVKLLHPDFYENLEPENLKKYEPILAEYALLPKYTEQTPFKMPQTDLVAWSRTVNGWRCKRDTDFFLSPEKVCAAINAKTDSLLDFLTLLKENKKIELANTYSIIPNMDGALQKKNDLMYADFMDDNVFNLVNDVMGSDRAHMLDPKYKDLCDDFTDYTKDDLQKAISYEADSLNRTAILKGDALEKGKIPNLIKFCSAFHLDVPNNRRSKLIPLIAKYFDLQYERSLTIRFLDDQKDEELFYEPIFKFLVDYTLNCISKKSQDWVRKNKEWLIDFLTTYSPSSDEKRRKKLDDYAVVPNQYQVLCKISDLKKNKDIGDDMVGFYDTVFGLKEIELPIENSEDGDTSHKASVSALRYGWIDCDFVGIVDKLKEDSSNEIANAIEATLVTDMRQEDKSKRKFEISVRQIILKFNNKETGKTWADWFPQIFEKKAEYIFSMKEGDEQENLFKLMDLNKDNLKVLADISQAPNLVELLENAKTLLEREKERERQFNFTYMLGKLIEDILREEVSDELTCTADDIQTDDEQNGQDMKIRYKGQVLYYLESKAKWNFSEAAHMSSQQMKQAVRNSKDYAVLCVDCTQDTGASVSPEATKDDIYAAREDIMNHTRVHINIGDTLSPTVRPLIEHEDNKALDEDKSIRVYSSLSCNIPKAVFISGTPFKDFLSDLKVSIQRQIESLSIE